MKIPLLNKPTISRIHFILISAALLAVLAASPTAAGQATITWHSNQESDLAGYNLYYGKKKGFYEQSVDVGMVAQYTLTDLEDNIPYYVALTAYDLIGNESAYSQEVSFTSIVNQSPLAPGSPSGPANGYALTAYTFETSASDPDGDDLQYQFDWGDKSQSKWGPASQNHQWHAAGSYCVKTRATDPDGARSDWSGCLNLVLEPMSYKVAASAGENGTISPVGQVYVAHGTDQTFTISANENCHVAEVMVDGKSVGPVQSYTFSSVHTGHSISAVFSPNNQLPVAEAGANQMVDRGVIVKLDGSGSRDPDGGIASYAWKQLSGIPVTLKNPKSVEATFISPPSATPDISLAFALTVTDHSGAKNEDTCAILFTANPCEDVDQDGINDSHDNCPGIDNSEQVDKDVDGVGDPCDAFNNDRNEWFDSDKDGIGDNADPDDDNDGLPDVDEIATYHTDPINPDTDQDGFSDRQEILAGSDPLDGQSIPAERVAFTVYEDAEDGRIDGWEITDNDPSGANIANVFDDQRQSLVIELTGMGTDNAFHLANPDMTPWRNSSQFILEWSMQFSDDIVILVELSTTAGKRLLQYAPVTDSALGTGEVVQFGLGKDSDNGQWQTIARDLKADLAKAQPDVTILEVNGLIVQGAGRIDDVKLFGAVAITVDFSNRGSAGANLGHEVLFDIGKTGEQLKATAWGLNAGPDYPGFFAKHVFQTSGASPSGNGLGVTDSDNFQKTINQPSMIDGVNADRHKEFLKFETTSSDLFIESITVDIYSNTSERIGWFEISLANEKNQRSQILDEAQLPPGVGFHGNAKITLDQTEYALRLLEYDSGSNGIFVGSYLMKSLADNIFFYVSSLTVRSKLLPTPQPTIMALPGAGQGGLAE